jgi:transposase
MAGWCRTLVRIADTVFYQLRTGVQWHLLPKGLPPCTAVWRQFRRWRDTGIWTLIMQHLLRVCRVEAGRKPEPSAALLDAQSVPSGCLGPREHVGVDGGKRVRGRKRHLLCDLTGLPIAINVTSAQPHDSRGGWTLLKTVKPQVNRPTKVFADSAYHGLAARAELELGLSIDIRKRPDGTHWFVPLQPLWRVERTFAWLGRNRRLLYDYEATVASSEAFVHAGAVALMLGRLHPHR